MTKPTFLLVPGAWHQPDIYSNVIDNLSAHGYPTVSLPLPSAGAVPPNTSFNEDVNAIRASLTKLVDTEEKEVILVVHSYTGMPGTEAPKGLGRKERQEKGLKGGVVRLVFIMAFAMPEGFQPTAGGAQMPEWMKLDLEVSLLIANNALPLYLHRFLEVNDYPLEHRRRFTNISFLKSTERHRDRLPVGRQSNILQRPLLRPRR